MANQDTAVKLLQAMLQTEIGTHDITPSLIAEKLDWLLQHGPQFSIDPEQIDRQATVDEMVRRFSWGPTMITSTTYHQVQEDSRRRVARMNVWIDLAQKTPDDDEHAHIRFVFYWIAYEAAYQAENYGPHSDGRGVRNAFHAKLARHDRGRLRNILREAKEDVVAILQLRQASEYFWRKDEDVRSPDDWEQRFEERTRKAKRRLEAAIDEWRSPKSDDRTRDTLDDLFRCLNLVRNQIVHGGSAGPQSQGRTQVLLAARLLTALVPVLSRQHRVKARRGLGKAAVPARRRRTG